MPKYPGARWRPVTRYLPGGSSNQPLDGNPVGVDHTYVGSPTHDAAFERFNVSGTPIPHFMVFRDGSIDQYVDTAFRSSACLDGNHRTIAWETSDGYPSLWSAGGTEAPKDNAAMVAAKARLMVWLHKTHGIPLERMANSRSTSHGFGWHRLGIDGNFETPPGTLLGGRVSGGEKWSPSFGKTCPTSVRIHQFVEETIPAAVDLAKPKPLEQIRVEHLSGHWNATAAQLTAALHTLALAADVITLTEVSPTRFADVLETWADDNGWHIYHPSEPGQNECAILSRTRFQKTVARRLTDLTLKSGRTAPLYLVTARTRGIWVGVWHSPAHTGGLIPGRWATRVYRSALAGLHAVRMRMHGRIILTADWNLDLNRPQVRALLQKPYPHLRWAWADGQKPTLGGRVIDGALTNLAVVKPATTLPSIDGFDHKPLSLVVGKPKEQS